LKAFESQNKLLFTFFRNMLIKVEETETRGKAVVATKRLEPGLSGLVVITEKALIIFPTLGRDENNSDGPVPDFLEPNPQLFSDWCRYLEQPEDVQKRILSLYNDMECRK
jgi:hypothetical protein